MVSDAEVDVSNIAEKWKGALENVHSDSEAARILRECEKATDEELIHEAIDYVNEYGHDDEAIAGALLVALCQRVQALLAENNRAHVDDAYVIKALARKNVHLSSEVEWLTEENAALRRKLEGWVSNR